MSESAFNQMKLLCFIFVIKLMAQSNIFNCIQSIFQKKYFNIHNERQQYCFFGFTTSSNIYKNILHSKRSLLIGESFTLTNEN